MSIELATLIKEQKSELKEISSGLAEGKPEKVVTALMTLGAGLAIGHPELAVVLSPFLQQGVQRAFATSATRRLQAALAELEAQDEKAAFTGQIAQSVEALLGQALIQMVRVQHATKDEVLDALGGLRQELADFREDFQDQLDDRDVRIDRQRVREGATGMRISDGARAHIWVGEMTVSGAGSVGIDVTRR